MNNLAEKSESRYKVIFKTVDIGKDKDGIWFRIFWNDLSDNFDWTWRLALLYHKDIYKHIVNFLLMSDKEYFDANAMRQLVVST